MLRILLVFVLIIFSISIFATINNFYFFNMNNSKESISKQIALITLQNPTASNNDSNLKKRTLLLDENGMIQNKVLYEESNLTDDELKEITNKLK